jgi:ring-1,2-phenylacetyl-CoA epoxidase subunit PaaD
MSMVSSLNQINSILNDICDPEIPVLSIKDIGILRDVKLVDGIWIITITPTYSGCPAMNMIEANIKLTLAAHGIDNYQIISQLSPAWTTDWMTDTGKAKLEQYGIAPPNPSREDRPVQCPQCKSQDVVEVSRFGSTACKSLWKCNACLEPFDYFKCH